MVILLQKSKGVLCVQQPLTIWKVTKPLLFIEYGCGGELFLGVTVMNYAGTTFLQNEAKVMPVSELKMGDFICNDSRVVMIVDIAENDKGEKCYLIGQSYIQAMCFHIVIN